MKTLFKVWVFISILLGLQKRNSGSQIDVTVGVLFLSGKCLLRIEGYGPVSFMVSHLFIAESQRIAVGFHANRLVLVHLAGQ